MSELLGHNRRGCQGSDEILGSPGIVVLISCVLLRALGKALFAPSGCIANVSQIGNAFLHFASG